MQSIALEVRVTDQERDEIDKMLAWAYELDPLRGPPFGLSNIIARALYLKRSPLDFLRECYNERKP